LRHVKEVICIVQKQHQTNKFSWLFYYSCKLNFSNEKCW